MTRQDIIKFYENKIDDVADESVREELFKELAEIEEYLESIDNRIDDELENQESEYIEDEIGYDYEYYIRSVREWIYMKNYLIYKQV